MCSSRRLLLLMAVLSVGGCMQTTSQLSPPPPAVARAASSSALDSFAYDRGPPAQPQAYASPAGRYRPAATAHAQARPVPAPPHTAYRADPSTRGIGAREGSRASEPPYTLDTGDKLRITVFGQDGLSNSYFVDAAGAVTLPLIGSVRARGLTTQQLSQAIAERLRRGFIREPHVAVEVEIYRPFFILGEVTAPGQYPYVPDMTIETAVAIAGGFTPRAYRREATIDRSAGGALRSRISVPLLTRVRPGDTIIIKERWF